MIGSWFGRHSAKLIYGAIVLSALMGAMSDPLPPSGVVILAIVLPLVLISVAGALAQSIADDIERHRLTSWPARLRSMLTPSPMVAAGVVPLVFFGLSWVGLLSRRVAFRATETVLLMMLAFFGFMASRLAGAGRVRSILTGAVVVFAGLLVVEAKILAMTVLEALD
ncbi:MAG: hypothetical protein AAF500_14150 [Myxococcota bacterium]